jgi:hypothetical protein
MARLIWLAPLAALLSAPAALAIPELRSDRVHTADAKKTQAYVRDGLVVGGDNAIDGVVVKDIRRATNKGYERVVIDLEGTKAGEPAAISRAPYYQVAISPDERRLVMTIWGKPRLGFDSKRVASAFRRSKVVEKLELLPVLEEDSWTFVFDLKEGHAVEVFELGSPVRVILDIRNVPGGGGLL